MPRKDPLYPHVPKGKTILPKHRRLEQTEMLIYDDGRYRVSLKANGMYTIEEYEPANKRWYGMATGNNRHMMEIAQDANLPRLLTILT